MGVELCAHAVAGVPKPRSLLSKLSNTRVLREGTEVGETISKGGGVSCGGGIVHGEEGVGLR